MLLDLAKQLGAQRICDLPHSIVPAPFSVDTAVCPTAHLSRLLQLTFRRPQLFPLKASAAAPDDFLSALVGSGAARQSRSPPWHRVLGFESLQRH